MVNISFSWDDGSIYDLKLAELMNKYDIQAMFFIPAKNVEQPYLSKYEILELYNNNMDIGGHTYNHVYLTQLPFEQVENEIQNGKNYIEDIIQQEMDFFCYPGGFYDEKISTITQKHFKKARTADTMRFTPQANQFNVDTAFHFYDRGVKSILKNNFKNDKVLVPLILSSLSLNTFKSYKNILKNLSKKNKNFNINIWGHGWEIEQFGLWHELEEFLKYIQSNNFKIQSMKEMYL